MKRALLAAAALLFAGTLGAQTPAAATGSPFSFGLLAGATIPSGDFSNAAGTGWHAGGMFNYMDPGWPVGVRLDAVYHGFGSKDLDTGEGTASFQPKIIAVTANVLWSFPMDAGAPVRPYVIAGVGYYHLSEDCSGNGCIASLSENKFGINGGAGVEIPLSGFNTFVEARFHNIFTDNSSTRMIPVSVGIVFR